VKIIQYKFLSCEVNRGTDEQPNIKQIFLDKVIHCVEADLEVNEETAKKEAYNGEYTIEDDGQPEPQTPEERIAELEQALELLLSGVTE